MFEGIMDSVRNAHYTMEWYRGAQCTPDRNANITGQRMGEPAVEREHTSIVSAPTVAMPQPEPRNTEQPIPWTWPVPSDWRAFEEWNKLQ